MKRLYGEEDIRTAIYAALLKNGGVLECSFEELGEAALIAKLGEVALVVERTASGVRYTMSSKLPSQGAGS